MRLITDIAAAVFFSDGEGDLFRADPRQEEMNLQEAVKDARA